MNNNVNIQQGQLNFDWFTHYCVVTKRFDWLKEETHILSLKRVRGLLMNIHEFRNTLIRVSYHMGQYQLLSVLAARLSPLNIDHSRNLPVEISGVNYTEKYTNL